MAGAGEDEDRAARIFVARRVRARQRRAPDGRRVDEGLRRDGAERGFRDSDVGEPDRAAERAPRQQQVPGLEPEEGDAGARLDRRAANLAGSPIDARGDVDGEHAPAGVREGVDALDDRLRFALHLAGESGPEQRVDHAVSARDVNRRKVEGRPRIARGGQRRIAFQRVAPAEQSDLDLISARREQSRGDKAIAAVAAGAAEDGDPAARLCQPGRLVGDCEPRPLHERDARRSRCDRKAIGLAHFSGRQQFRERLWIAHGSEGARRLRHAQAAKKRAFHRAGFCYIPAALIPDSSAGRAFDC